MTKLKTFLGILFFIILLPAVIAIFIPLGIITLPFTFFSKNKFKREYSEYLRTLEGTNFFCYNNRKNSQEFIEREIIPNLEQTTKIIFLNGKKVESEFEQKFITQALYNLNNYNKFPHLIKIRQGKIVDKSINNLFYNFLNQNNDRNKFLRKVESFFAE